jgi:transcriptional regulator with XRE-family HTH domain
MDFKRAFGIAFKEARVAKKLTQEDFGLVSSRTYISTIERGLKAVTLEKLNELSTVLNMLPMTLIGMAYLKMDANLTAEELSEKILDEIKSLSS